MKRKLNRVSMAIVATVLFFGVLLLSVEQNETGGWQFATLSALAHGESGGGEEGEDEDEGGLTIVQFFHYELSTVSGGAEDFADGVAQCDPYYAGGIAAVVTPSYTLRSVIYTKTADGSSVMGGVGYYFIGYQADYTTSAIPVGTITVLDSFNESI